MKNKPVAWIDKNTGKPRMEGFIQTHHDIPLYTQDQLEEARKLGMQQERAMWELAASTQEIMDTHPVKELTDEEIMSISETFEDRFVDTEQQWSACILDFARAILRKAQEADKIESLGTVNIGGVHYRNGKEVK